MKPCHAAIPTAAVFAFLVVACTTAPRPSAAGTYGETEREPFAAQPPRDQRGGLEAAVGADSGPAASASASAPQPTAVAEAVEVDAEVAPSRPPSAPPSADGPRSAAPAAPAVSEAAAAPAGSGPHTASSDRQRERDLRTRFARAEQVTPVAVELAAFLVERERHDEALVVVDGALGRERTSALRIARAGLLRDLAQPAAAARELEALQHEFGSAGVRPGTLFELAQVQWVAGRTDDALETVGELQRAHADDPWLMHNAEEVRDFAELAQGSKAGYATVYVRDLLALLRGAPRPIDRVQLLERMTRPGAPEREPIRRRAVAIASGDPSPAVRSEVLHAAASVGVVEPAYWRAALADPSAFVRRVAPEACREALGEQAPRLLLAALREETDTLAFAALEQALARAVGVRATPCDAKDPTQRQRIVEMWEERCGG